MRLVLILLSYILSVNAASSQTHVLESKQHVVTLSDNIALLHQKLKGNTEYVIDKDIDLNNTTITFPPGSLLSFTSGSLINGTILGNPNIRANDYQIFYNISTDITEVKSEWIGVFPYGHALTNRNNLDYFISRHRSYNTLEGNRLDITFTKCLTYEFSSGIVFPDSIMLYFQGATSLKDQMTMLRCRKKGETLFTVMGGQFCASNIAFGGMKGDSYDYGTRNCTVLIDYKKSISPKPSEGCNDTDARLENCKFRLSNIGIRLTGRQSIIRSCAFSDCNVCVLVDDIENPDQTISGSSRNNRVTGCHFHSSVVTAIWCKGAYQRHLTVDNNIMDVAAGRFFKGYLRSGFIYNNNVHYTINTLGLEEVNIFELDCFENSFITGNKCDYANDFTYSGMGYPNRCNSFVKCTGSVINSDITNNKFGESLDYGFCFGSMVSGLTVKNNTIVSSCKSKKYSRVYSNDPNSKLLATLVKFDSEIDKIDKIYIDGNVVDDKDLKLITEAGKIKQGYIQNDKDLNKGILKYGSTQGRPNGNSIDIGFQYFDTTLNRPIWYAGADVWVDYEGEKIDF
jgi:hypothetical protein